MIKVKWDVEELVALIDLYLRDQRGEILNCNTELEELSNALRIRADILGIVHDDKYRNMNGMKMMYQNIAFIASNGVAGMSSYSQAMDAVFDMSVKCPNVFLLILSEFNERYRKRKKDKAL